MFGLARKLAGIVEEDDDEGAARSGEADAGDCGHEPHRQPPTATAAPSMTSGQSVKAMSDAIAATAARAAAGAPARAPQAATATAAKTPVRPTINNEGGNSCFIIAPTLTAALIPSIKAAIGRAGEAAVLSTPAQAAALTNLSLLQCITKPLPSSTSTASVHLSNVSSNLANKELVGRVRQQIRSLHASSNIDSRGYGDVNDGQEALFTLLERELDVPLSTTIQSTQTRSHCDGRCSLRPASRTVPLETYVTVRQRASRQRPPTRGSINGSIARQSSVFDCLGNIATHESNVNCPACHPQVLDASGFKVPYVNTPHLTHVHVDQVPDFFSMSIRPVTPEGHAQDQLTGASGIFATIPLVALHSDIANGINEPWTPGFVRTDISSTSPYAYLLQSVIVSTRAHHYAITVEEDGSFLVQDGPPVRISRAEMLQRMRGALPVSQVTYLRNEPPEGERSLDLTSNF